MPQSGSEPLLVERRDDGVVIMRLNRPERRNALSRELIDSLRETCAAIAADDDVRAVVLTGGGGAFCAGLDLHELGDQGTNLDGRFIEDIRGLPQPTIAAVDGPAVTAGIEMALACDIRLGSATARFADTHVRVGVLPGGGATVMLPRVVGLGRAKEMSLSGRAVHAEEAERWGLLNRIVDADVVDAAVELAGVIAGNVPDVVRSVKALIDEGQDRGVEDALMREREAFRRFAERFRFEEVAGRRDSVFARGRRESTDRR